MKIEHIALWTNNLEQLKTFYEEYFGAVSGDKYHNPKNNFSSYFLSFASGTRLELMSMPGLLTADMPVEPQRLGFIHIAFSMGSKELVDNCFVKMQSNGCELIDEPHITGDGYYEFTVLDPDGNRVEVTV